jgi:hypothetical protein
MKKIIILTNQAAENTLKIQFIYLASKPRNKN